MHARKTQTVIQKISNTSGGQRGGVIKRQVGDITHRGCGVNVLWCWVTCNEFLFSTKSNVV